MKELINTFSDQILIGLIILSGSLTHAIAQLKTARDGGDSLTIIDFIILVPLSAFSGLYFAFAALYLSYDMYLVFMFAGAGSFLGVAGLNLIVKRVLELLILGGKSGK